MSTATMISSTRYTPLAKETMMDTPELVIAAQDVLRQGLRLLSTLSDAKYSRVVAAPFNASIGQHYRHVLEHFQCLINGLPVGEVNYDARQRNPRIENEAAFATTATGDVLNTLQTWTDATLGHYCASVSSVAYSSAAPSRIDSNIARELAYCIGHAIHHYAIIRLVCNEVGVSVPAEFGYAPSTIKYQSTMAAD